jgi:hypothetical protein
MCLCVCVSSTSVYIYLFHPFCHVFCADDVQQDGEDNRSESASASDIPVALCRHQCNFVLLAVKMDPVHLSTLFEMCDRVDRHEHCRGVLLDVQSTEEIDSAFARVSEIISSSEIAVERY